MNSGLLKYRITLNLKSFSQESDYGGMNDVESNILKWSAIKWVQAKEKLTGGVLSNIRQAVFTIRYSDNVKAITSRDSITYDGNIFDIQSVSYKGQSNKSFIEIIGECKN
mgnify:CR=1 FL=1